jgi:hypothetical protein
MSTAPAGAATVPLTTYLLRSGEMLGFVVTGAPHTATGASAWVRHVEDETGTTAAKDVRGLQAAGFMAGAYVNLRSRLRPSSGAGGSTVLLFATAADARRDVATQYAQGVAIQGSGAVIHRLVLSLPGARGFTTVGSGPHPAGAANAYFSSGRCLFVVGDFLDGTNPATALPVVVGVRRLAARATGVCRR